MTDARNLRCDVCGSDVFTELQPPASAEPRKKPRLVALSIERLDHLTRTIRRLQNSVRAYKANADRRRGERKEASDLRLKAAAVAGELGRAREEIVSLVATLDSLVVETLSLNGGDKLEVKWRSPSLLGGGYLGNAREAQATWAKIQLATADLFLRPTRLGLVIVTPEGRQLEPTDLIDGMLIRVDFSGKLAAAQRADQPADEPENETEQSEW